jgi:hypothetical protein
VHGVRFAADGQRLAGLQALMCLADEELDGARFESEVRPFADGEFEVEREVPSNSGDAINDS